MAAAQPKKITPERERRAQIRFLTRVIAGEMNAASDLSRGTRGFHALDTRIHYVNLVCTDKHFTLELRDRNS